MKKATMLKNKCIEQNLFFNNWDISKDYFQFHHSHYDWWAFPVDRPSSYGDKYQVGEQQWHLLIEDQQFIHALRSNAILVCRAWGYQLVQGTAVHNPTKDQKWQNWPIRLYKLACSLELFKQFQLHAHAIQYGLSLIKKGFPFRYRGDLSSYFEKHGKNKQQPKIKMNLSNHRQPEKRQNNRVSLMRQNDIKKQYEKSIRAQHKIFQTQQKKYEQKKSYHSLMKQTNLSSKYNKTKPELQKSSQKQYIYIYNE